MWAPSAFDKVLTIKTGKVISMTTPELAADLPNNKPRPQSRDKLHFQIKKLREG
jgi:hypothetical protein